MMELVGRGRRVRRGGEVGAKSEWCMGGTSNMYECCVSMVLFESSGESGDMGVRNGTVAGVDCSTMKKMKACRTR